MSKKNSKKIEDQKNGAELMAFVVDVLRTKKKNSPRRRVSLPH